MLDKTIDSALLALRRQINQSDGKGREHVEALLRQRGVPMPRAMPPRLNVAGSGVMARMALDALREGPQTTRYVSEYIAERRPKTTFDKAHVFTAVTLTKLKKRGLVAHDGKFGGLWSVADHAARCQ